MTSNVFIAFFGVIFALSSHAAERAAISNCCVGSGTILEIDATTFSIERSVDIGANSINAFSTGGNMALSPDGQSAVVESLVWNVTGEGPS